MDEQTEGGWTRERPTEAEIDRLLNIESFINDMLSDGCDCPFCDFQQFQWEGHLDYCPMNEVPQPPQPQTEKED